MRSLAVSVILSTIVASAAPLVGQRSGCGPTQRPHQLPAVQALLDSSAAIMELQAAHLLRDSMQFTLLVLAGDSQPVIHALDSTDHVAADVIARSAWPQKPAELWAVRLHVTGGAAPALTVTRATYCPPQLAPVPGRTRRAEMGVLREERVVTTSGSGTRTVLGVPPTLPPRTVVFEIQLTARGEVHSVKLINSTGHDDIDQAIIEHARQDKYEPARIDGIPIPVVYRTDKSSPRP